MEEDGGEEDEEEDACETCWPKPESHRVPPL